MVNPFGHSALLGPDAFSDGRRLQVGVLTNPRSGGNKKGGRAIRNVLANWPDVLQRDAVDPDSVSKALSDFANNGVELVVVNGGDGTIHAALTAIGNEQFFAQPPLLALLCAGTTSMLPRDVGVAGAPAAALAQLLEWAKCTDVRFSVQPRHILHVLGSSKRPPLFGMFFGAGAICQGIKLFHSEDNPMGWRGQLMPAVTMLRFLWAILSKDRVKISPFLTKTSLDARTPEKKSDLFVLVSSLERLLLGMRPYWGRENGPLRYTAVDTEPKYLLRVLTSLLRSKESRHATPVNGYYSHNVHKVQLVMDGEFTLDGELYAAGEEPVTIESSGPAMFVVQGR